ncbi:MAG: GIY-YIG nuclease family protein [Sphingomonadales bacterium]
MLSQLNCNMAYYVYILASGRNGTLYVGVTNDLVRRCWEHREALAAGFTRQYGVKHLVYFEQADNIQSAIVREKRLKKYRRAAKIALIERQNVSWRDLFPDIAQ